MLIPFLGIFGWIKDAITHAVLDIIWLVLIQGPLALIDAFDQVFKFLTSGIFYDVLFGGKTFTPDKIPAGFYIFCFLAIFIAVMVFIVQYLTLLIVDEGNLRDRLVQSLKSSFKGILFTIIIPICFFLACVIMEWMQKIVMGTFGGTNNSFAKMLYKLGDPTWNGENTDDVPDKFGVPGNVMSYNIIVEIVGVWFMGYTILMVGLAVASKIFELYLLFVIGPIFAATMPNDDGLRMKTWRDSSMGKMFVVLGSLIVYDVFIVLMSLLVKICYAKFSGTANAIPRMLVIIILLLGGGVFVQVMPSFFANFFNEKIGAAEGRASIRGAMAAGGMFRSGGLGILSAIGIGKAARERKETKNKRRATKFSSRMNPFGASDGAGKGNGGNNSNNDNGPEDYTSPTPSFDSDSSQPAPLAGMAMRGVGAIGLTGKVVRTASTLVGAGLTAGAGVLSVAGWGSVRRKSRARVGRAMEGAKTNFNNATKTLAFKTSDALRKNTVDHLGRKSTHDAKNQRDMYSNKINQTIDKSREKMTSHLKNYKENEMSERQKNKLKNQIKNEKLKQYDALSKREQANELDKKHNSGVIKHEKRVDDRTYLKADIAKSIKKQNSPNRYVSPERKEAAKQQEKSNKE